MELRQDWPGPALGGLDWERGPNGTVPGLAVWSLMPDGSPLIQGWGKTSRTYCAGSRTLSRDEANATFPIQYAAGHSRGRPRSVRSWRAARHHERPPGRSGDRRARTWKRQGDRRSDRGLGGAIRRAKRTMRGDLGLSPDHRGGAGVFDRRWHLAISPLARAHFPLHSGADTSAMSGVDPAPRLKCHRNHHPLALPSAQLLRANKLP